MIVFMLTLPVMAVKIILPNELTFASFRSVSLFLGGVFLSIMIWSPFGTAIETLLSRFFPKMLSVLFFHILSLSVLFWIIRKIDGLLQGIELLSVKSVLMLDLLVYFLFLTLSWAGEKLSRNEKQDIKS